MSTSYRIEPGYNSAHSKSVVWAEMKRVVVELRTNPSLIIDEVMQIEPNANRLLITSVAYWYGMPENLAIRVVNWKDGGYVVQFSSGYRRERDAKESCLRAVCRIIIRELHKKQMEVSITVS